MEGYEPYVIEGARQLLKENTVWYVHVTHTHTHTHRERSVFRTNADAHLSACTGQYERTSMENTDKEEHCFGEYRTQTQAAHLHTHTHTRDLSPPPLSLLPKHTHTHTDTHNAQRGALRSTHTHAQRGARVRAHMRGNLPTVKVRGT